MIHHNSILNYCIFLINNIVELVTSQFVIELDPSCNQSDQLEINRPGIAAQDWMTGDIPGLDVREIALIVLFLAVRNGPTTTHSGCGYFLEFKHSTVI